MKKYLFFLIITFALSCGKNVDCPAFTDEDMSFIPYSENQVLLFTNLDGDTLKFIVHNIEKSPEYSFKCKDLNKICNCQSSAVIKTTNNLEPDTAVFLLFEKNSVSTSKYYYYHVLDFYFEIDFEDYYQNLNYLENVRFYDTLTVSNVRYDDVFSIENDNNTQKVLKVFLNQEHGILRIVETTPTNNWAICN